MLHWTWNGKEWERHCQLCGGTGKVTLHHGGRCMCPWGSDLERIDHPDNDKSHGIGNELCRCIKCGGVWRIYFETTDDSWDVPAPDYIGREIPPLNWRFSKEVDVS